jgi:hypothetical protein
MGELKYFLGIQVLEGRKDTKDQQDETYFPLDNRRGLKYKCRSPCHVCYLYITTYVAMSSSDVSRPCRSIAIADVRYALY